MDRNTLLGLLLIIMLVLGWSYYVGQQQEQERRQQQAEAMRDSLDARRRSDSAAQRQESQPRAGAQDTAAPAAAQQQPASAQAAAPDTAKPGPAPAKPDSALRAQRRRRQYGRFAPLARGQDTALTVTTEEAKFTFNTRGGLLKEVELRNFKTEEGQPVPVIQQDTSSYFTFAIRHEGKIFTLRDLHFEPSFSDSLHVSKGQSKTLTFRAAFDQNHYIEQQYTLKGDRFEVDYNLVLHGMQELINDPMVEFRMNFILPQTERSRENMLRRTTIYTQYWEPDGGGDIEDVGYSPSRDEPEQEAYSTSLKWVASKSHFFNAAFIAKDRFENGRMAVRFMPPGKGVQEHHAKLEMPYNKGGHDEIGMTMYFGPNDAYILDDYGVSLDRLVYLGWGPIRFINYGIMSVFKLLEGAFSSYGIIILILAVGVKLLLTPLTYKSFVSQAKMQVVNQMPEIKELEEQYQDDQQKLQQKKMQFYSQVGVSPFGGCLPLLLQLPILVAMFNFFPNSIELRHESFLWAQDLSTYDSIYTFPDGFSIPFYGDHISLFTLLWVGSQIIFAFVQQKQQSTPQNAPKLMKYLPFFMPIILLGVFNNYSAALSYYYLIFNLITIGQTFVTKAFFIDEEKIKQDIHAVKEGKGGKKKKGGFAAWVERQQQKREEMMQEQKAQMRGRSGRREVQQKQQNKKKKKKK